MKKIEKEKIIIKELKTLEKKIIKANRWDASDHALHSAVGILLNFYKFKPIDLS